MHLFLLDEPALPEAGIVAWSEWRGAARARRSRPATAAPRGPCRSAWSAVTVTVARTRMRTPLSVYERRFARRSRRFTASSLKWTACSRRAASARQLTTRRERLRFSWSLRGLPGLSVPGAGPGGEVLARATALLHHRDDLATAGGPSAGRSGRIRAPRSSW